MCWDQEKTQSLITENIFKRKNEVEYDFGTLNDKYIPLTTRSKSHFKQRLVVVLILRMSTFISPSFSCVASRERQWVCCMTKERESEGEEEYKVEGTTGPWRKCKFPFQTFNDTLSDSKRRNQEALLNFLFWKKLLCNSECFVAGTENKSSHHRF